MTYNIDPNLQLRNAYNRVSGTTHGRTRTVPRGSQRDSLRSPTMTTPRAQHRLPVVAAVEYRLWREHRLEVESRLPSQPRVSAWTLVARSKPVVL